MFNRKRIVACIMSSVIFVSSFNFSVCSVKAEELFGADKNSTEVSADMSEDVWSNEGTEMEDKITDTANGEAPDEPESEITDSAEGGEPDEIGNGTLDGADSGIIDEADSGKPDERETEIVDENEVSDNLEDDCEKDFEKTFSTVSVSDFRFRKATDGGYIVIGYDGTDEEITIPELYNGMNVHTIGAMAFLDCDGLYSVTLHKDLYTVEKSAFHGCKSLKNIFVDVDNEYYVSVDGSLYNGSRYNGKTAGTYLIRCPEGREDAVNIPEGVTHIVSEAFYGCENLKSISIPASITSISINAFQGCLSVKDIYYAGSVEQWEKLKLEFTNLYGETGIENAEIHYNFASKEYQYSVLEDGTLEITGYAGMDSAITIPAWLDGKWVTHIGNRAFNNCSNLSCVNIPDGVVEIGNEAFYGCENLSSISIPKSMVSIGNGSFDSCAALQDVYYAGSEEQWDGIKKSGLVDVKIYFYCNPSDYRYTVLDDGTVEVTGYIGADTDIIIPTYLDGKQVTGIGKQAFAGLSSICGISIPDSVKSIGDYAFAVCSSLSNMDMPVSLTHIGKYAFNMCSKLSGISIYTNVTSVDEYAFNECVALKDVYYSGNRKQWRGVTVAKGNAYLENAEIHYADDTEEVFLPCTVSFNTGGVVSIPNQTVLEYGLVSRPADPVRSGYVFKGWYYGDHKWDFDYDKVTGNMVLDARWEDEESITVKNGKKYDKDGSLLLAVGMSSIFYADPAYKGASIANYAENSTSWSIDNSNVLDISASSGESTKVTAIAAGTATLKENTVSKLYTDFGDNKWTLSDVITTSNTYKFRVVDYISAIKMDSAMKLNLNQSLPIHYQTVPAGNYSRNVSDFKLVSSDTDVASVSEDGIVTARGCGTAIITASAINGSGVKYEAKCIVTVVQGAGIGGNNDNDDDDSDDVLLGDIPETGIPEGLWIAGIEDCIYTGSAVKQEHMRVYDSDRRLKIGRDYTVSYKNNVKANDAAIISKAPTVIVKGKGNYTGTEKAFFKILPVDLDSDVVVSEDIVVTYNNKNQKKIPSLLFHGKKLANKRDFVVSYPSVSEGKYAAYKDAGVYDILLTAKEGGNFTGTRTVKITITNSTLISKATVMKIPSQTYTGNAVEPVIIATVKNTPLTVNEDFTVSYTNNTEIGTATIVLTGIGQYAGTKKISFKIVGRSLKSAKVSGVENKIFNGSPQTQNITVSVGEKILTEKIDYDVTYSNHINAGTASITIKGINAYTGVIRKSFKIKAYDLAVDVEKKIGGLEKDIAVNYVKGGSRPAVELTFAGGKLAEGKDYSVSYKHNKDITGTDTKNWPMITIKGKGNFRGSVYKYFTIKGKELTDSEFPVAFTVADKAFANKAGKYISKPVLTDSDGKKLQLGKDYTVISYILEDGSEEGVLLTNQSIVEPDNRITVKIRGNGTSYIGEAEAVYRITQKDFSKAKIKISNQTYTGKEIVLSEEDIISAKIGDTNLVYGRDYEIASYTNNIKKGVAKAIIIGKGSYGGIKTVQFKITAKKIQFFP